MRILVACECFGRVRDAFRDRGHDAWSCDLLGPDDLPDIFRSQRWGNYHLEGDVRDFLHEAPGGGKWEMMIAFPDCTYLASSGLHWNGRRPGREEKTKKALRFVETLLDADIERIALENPIGCLSTLLMSSSRFASRPDQIIQPHQFGEDASKATCLWLKNLPPLRPTKLVAPRIVAGKRRWSNQTDSGQNRLTPSPMRALLRAATPVGLAEAMAEQWGFGEKAPRGLFFP